jgi:hypothetical protein
LSVLLPDDEIPAAAAGLLGTWADSGILVGIRAADGAAADAAAATPSE